ncbi:D-alanyl-D-alanine carboxypeptidase [compost metagenome]
MNQKNFNRAFYIVIVVLILIFFTQDLDFTSEKKEETTFYKNIKLIETPSQLHILVNKNNQLPNDYVPNSLETISEDYANKGKMLRMEARKQFEELSKTSLILGYSIIAVSAYRDYLYQENLYNGYVETKGLEYADSCCARPGHSEHQTGLAVDVMGSNNDYDEFEKSPEFPWMRDNAHVFGFIL